MINIIYQISFDWAFLSKKIKQIPNWLIRLTPLTIFWSSFLIGIVRQMLRIIPFSANFRCKVAFESLWIEAISKLDF